MRISINFLIIVGMLLAGCTALSTTNIPTVESGQPEGQESQSSQAADLVITDALGRTVTIPAAPERIVLTGRALFMIADAAYLFPGAAQKIAGLGDTGQGSTNFIRLIDPNYEQKAKLEQDVSAEQVAALQPDLVILKSYLAETVGAPIEALGIPVVYVDFETPEQYTRDLAILGKIFEDEAQASKVASYYQSKIDEITNKVKDAPKPGVLMLYYNDKDGKVAFNVPPMGWMQSRMVEMAGGEALWAGANPGDGWTQVSLEQIAAWDADQIYIIAYKQDSADVVAGLKTDPNWQALRAVQNGQLFAFPGDFYSWDQPDPRWILGLSWLAGRIHPEIFSDLDITKETQAFYQELYGQDAQFFQENVVPAFKGDLP